MTECNLKTGPDMLPRMTDAPRFLHRSARTVSGSASLLMMATVIGISTKTSCNVAGSQICLIARATGQDGTLGGGPAAHTLTATLIIIIAMSTEMMVSSRKRFAMSAANARMPTLLWMKIPRHRATPADAESSDGVDDARLNGRCARHELNVTLRNVRTLLLKDWPNAKRAWPNAKRAWPKDQVAEQTQILSRYLFDGSPTACMCLSMHIHQIRIASDPRFTRYSKKQ